MQITLRVLRPRPVAAIGYIMLGVLGAAFYFWSPSQGMKDLLGETGFIFWNWFIMGGALIATAGCLIRHYYIELAGLPVLGAGIGSYGVYLLPRIDNAANAGTIFGFAMIFTFAAWEIGGRAYEVWHVIQISKEFQRRADGDN